MLNWIKNLFSFKKELPVIITEEVKVGHCDNHPKYKHRCPDCVEVANG